MRLTVMCTGVNQTVGSHGGTLYTYNFTTKAISADMKVQKELCQFNISSIEPLHYKHMSEYYINPPSTLMTV